MLRAMRRSAIVTLFAVLAACGGDKTSAPEHRIPQVVKAGAAAACKADTATLRSAEQAAFAATDAYTEQASPLHKVTVNGDDYVITVVDKRCGTPGHAVGQTAADN
jgi:hypothetical protein